MSESPRPLRIGGAVLAAGASSRLGRPKQLLDHAGKPLLRHAVQQLSAAGLARAAVVLGSAAEASARVLPPGECEVLDNPGWAEGVASSIRVAAEWASANQLDALLLAVCDQPLLTAAHLQALCDEHAARNVTVASGYAGTCGVPAVFGASWYPQLRALSGDRGARALLRADPRVFVIEWPDGAQDLDTEADAAALFASAPHSR